MREVMIVVIVGLLAAIIVAGVLSISGHNGSPLPTAGTGLRFRREGQRRAKARLFLLRGRARRSAAKLLTKDEARRIATSDHCQ